MLIAVVIVIILIVLWYLTPKYHKYGIGVYKIHVLDRYENSKDAAILVAQTFDRVMDLMRAIRDEYQIDDTPVTKKDTLERRIADYMLNNFNYEVIYENDIGGSDTSFTFNKGDRMYLCLRDRDEPQKLIDANTLMFVILHEIAHIAHFFGWGHGPEFWSVFKFILTKAVKAGIYTYTDYKSKPVKYCGLDITHQPLDD